MPVGIPLGTGPGPDVEERAAMERMQVTVNGRVRSLADVGPHTSVLDWLRRQGLTGAKEGCAEGECGACAVLVARADGADGTRWTSINACLPPAVAFAGQELVTAEGLGTSGGPTTAAELHPVQQEMAERGGSQCGYCTPGVVCAMAAEFYRPERAARMGEAPQVAALQGEAPPDDIAHDEGRCLENGFDLHALSGNLCRCTGYRPIRDAARALGDPDPQDALALRRHRPAPPARPLTTRVADAEFSRPGTLAELLERRAEDPDAVLVAGATDLGVDANLRHARPPLLLAIDQLAELRTLEMTADQIEIGAALTLSEIERSPAGQMPLLEELIGQFASRLIRNSATLGGNLATGSPIGDAAPVLLALDARVVLTSLRGEREVPLTEYFTGYRQTVRGPDEIIRGIRIPRPVPTVSSFLKVAKRRFDDISAVAVALALEIRDGHVARVRIGVGGVAATPIRAVATEAALQGQPWTAQSIEGAAEVLAGEGTPMDDHRASARYRAAMLKQSLLRLASRAGLDAPTEAAR